MPRPCGTWTTPSRAIFSGGLPFSDSPSSRISPEISGNIPDSARNVVVLPAPFAPSSATISPSLTSRSMSNTTGRRP